MGDRLRCRPGDLAIVTRCRVPERIGLIVRVIERCNDHGYDWLCELQGPPVWGRDVDSGKKGFWRLGLFRDWNLTPIRGDPVSRDMSIEEEDHA
ncbi:hypothetical protein [Burkholderia gladioli]|uniref:hypothetical protein n=1 Tax=Burkholderia gladioli TaxID=28095 RepID=UPI00163EE8FF|nr:hypothetical protein [Burkholderia gladioli]